MSGAAAAGAPSDNTTMTSILDELQRAGWSGHLVAVEGATVRCQVCAATSDAADLAVGQERRLEGASDPDDMTLVVAAACPACATRSTIVLGFGPNASAADSDVVAALPRNRPG